MPCVNLIKERKERMETPGYIKSLLKPNGKPQGRRIWSVDLETVWLPFFTATNVMGETFIPAESLGAPLRLGYDQDGTVKFSKTGRPVIKVEKEIANGVKLARENFVEGLMAYARGVAIENAEGYKAQVVSAREAGAPIVTRDREALGDALEKLAAEAQAEAEVKAKMERKGKKPEVKQPEREAEPVAA